MKNTVTFTANSGKTFTMRLTAGTVEGWYVVELRMKGETKWTLSATVQKSFAGFRGVAHMTGTECDALQQLALKMGILDRIGY